MSQSQRSFMHSVDPVGPDGVVRCHCNIPIPRRTSRTPGNLNRDFYACTKSRDDPERCKLFIWADELPKKDNLESNEDGSSVMSTPSPSRPSQRQRAEQARTPDASPRKRPFSPYLSSAPSSSPLSPPMSVLSTPTSTRITNTQAGSSQFNGGRSQSSPEAKRNRLAAIEAALGSTPNRAAAGVQTDFVDEDEDEDEDGGGSTWFTASQGSDRGSDSRRIASFELPTTPSPHRSSKRARIADTYPDGYSHGSSENVRISTPPATRGNHLFPSLGDGFNSITATPTKGKGKERQTSISPQRHDLFGRDGQEGPSSFTRDDSSSRDSLSPHDFRIISASSGDVISPTQNDGELNVKTISDLIAGLSNAPVYIQKLERRKVAAEKSNEAKVKRIAALEEEILSLKEEKRVLKEHNSFLECKLSKNN